MRSRVYSLRAREQARPKSYCCQPKSCSHRLGRFCNTGCRDMQNLPSTTSGPRKTKSADPLPCSHASYTTQPCASFTSSVPSRPRQDPRDIQMHPSCSPQKARRPRKSCILCVRAQDYTRRHRRTFYHKRALSRWLPEQTGPCGDKLCWSRPSLTLQTPTHVPKTTPARPHALTPPRRP